MSPYDSVQRYLEETVPFLPALCKALLKVLAFLLTPTVLFGGAMLGIGVALADTQDPTRNLVVSTNMGEGMLQLGDVTLPGAMVVLGWLVGKWKPSVSIEVVHKADDALLKLLRSKKKDEEEE